MRASGKLYVPDAESIIPNLKRLTDHAHAHGIRIVASADDHVRGDAEISDAPDWKATFPPHCMRGTPGQGKIPETGLREVLIIEPERVEPVELRGRLGGHAGDVLLHKHRFDVFTNENAGAVVEVLDPSAIVLYGVALDVCDKAAIEGLLARRPQTRLFAVTDAMKPIDPRAAEPLLQAWARAGVRLVTTAEVLAGPVLAATRA